MSARKTSKTKRPAGKATQVTAMVRERIEAQRRRLLGADAVVVCCRYALDSQLEGLDELSVVDALQVASEIINNAAEALEVCAGGGEQDGAP